MSSASTAAKAGDPAVEVNESLSELVDTLLKFRNENLFTDISIYVEGVEFPCHKCILCASSSYFRAMFTCDLKESRLGKVYIENISPWTMKRLLDYIYTGKIEINLANVIDLLNSALLFELGRLVDKCVAFVLENIDLNNCVELNLFAYMHQLKELEQYTFQFILDNFMQLLSLSQRLEKERNESLSSPQPLTSSKPSEVTTTATTNLSSSSFTCLNEKTFTSLIKSDSLNVTREIYVYYALNKWAEHHQTTATGHNPQKFDLLYESLFKYIRLNGLCREELEFILKNDRFVQSNTNLLNRIQVCCAEISAMPILPCAANHPNITGSIAIPKTADLIGDLANPSKVSPAANSKSRPSTIPREYLCVLHTDRFFYFDFYKSKWDSLTDGGGGGGTSPVLNLSSPTAASSAFAISCSMTPVTNDSVFTRRLNGYSTCLIDNILYVMGGYLVNSFQTNDGIIQFDLVDTVFRFDPIRNEWSTCESMPTKRSFHTALHLTSSNGEDELILLFYGLHKNEQQRLAQCFHIDYYNINTNRWGTITLNTILNHHIFYLYNNQLNRGGVDIADKDLINFQVSLSRLIVSVKSLLYILNENCVRCYEFDTCIRQLNTLPYFQLPINNANNFVISATTIVTSTTALINMKSASFSSNGMPCYVGSGSEPSINAMLFTWYSQTNSEDSSTASSSLSSSEVSSPTVNNGETGAEVAPAAGDNDSNDGGEVVETRLFVKEALIYLLDTHNTILYEFYPAKNKLKKLPQLLHKHSFDSSLSSMILNIKSKVYVAGASNSVKPPETLVEVYDPDTNAWSVFLGKLEDAVGLGEEENGDIPLMKHFFKLKMSLF